MKFFVRGLPFVLVIVVLLLVPRAASADCDVCSDACTTFFDGPSCGVGLGTCEACSITCYSSLSGLECYCTLWSCFGLPGRGERTPFYPVAQLRRDTQVPTYCQMADAAKKHYRAVRVEVFSARS